MADKLLTVRQLQELLGVDRVTIYRLLDAGKLPGFKVGGQWRFSRAEIEAWLARQRGGAAGGGTEGHPPKAPAPYGVESLPLSCMEPVQDIFAQAVGAAALSVDPAGKPLTSINNPCAFCEYILSYPEGRARCRSSWARLVQNPLDPRAQRCHAGLRLLAESVDVDGERLAWVVAGGFVVGSLELEEVRQRVPDAAHAIGAPADELLRRLSDIHIISPSDEARAAGLLKKVAATFVELTAQRVTLLSRLQHIAELASLR